MDRLRLLVVLCLGWVAFAPSSGAAVIDSYNLTKSPAASAAYSFTEAGWFYTAPQSYSLDRIETLFGTGSLASAPVTLEVWTDLPTSAGATLLRSTTFDSRANVLSGGSFDPLPISVGERSFIALRNIKSLGANFTLGPNDQVLSNLFSISPSTHQWFDAGRQGNTPIFQFSGAVPEPNAGLLIVAGLASVLGRRER